MFYTLINQKFEPREAPDKGGLCVGRISAAELEKIAPVLGFSPSTVRQCREEVRYFRNSVEVYDNYSFGTVKRTTGDESGEDCIAIYIKRGLFLVVDIRDSDGSTRRAFDAALARFSPAGVTLEKLVFAFLDAMIEGDGKILEDKEFSLSEPEEKILCNNADDDFIALFLAERRRLLLWRNYYEQLIDVGKALGENENDLFSESDLRYFKIFTDKAERLERNVRALYEQLIQLREAYQSMLDIRLDNIMKSFTVLSALFLPLTLITGWYGMNFSGMPELSWQHGYLYVMILSITVALLLIGFFRRRHWM
ncbi:MAG: hypothetical protein IJW51_05795 [Clostridia bacterium]|nr:hypothetical protein [Clostridia bacterium]